MTKVFLAFEDSKKINVVGAFGSPQDRDEWPFIEEVSDTDKRYLEFLELFTPSPSSQASTARDELLRHAALRVAPLQDAEDLGSATAEEESLLLQWKQYRVDLNRIQDQAGFPDAILWPEPPTNE